jgi:uncharacterized membrane protein YfcA
MDIDWIVTLWSAFVVVVATTVHGITGFGTGQITMGVLPFFRDAGSASIVVSIVVFITNLRVFWSVREEFNWKDWIIPVAGLAAGLPVGIYLFGAWDEDQLRVAIGVVMMISAVVILLLRQIKWIREWIKGTGWQPGWISGVLAGFLSGVFGGAVSIPGPPMIIYGAFLMETGYWTAKQMKAIFTSFFAANLLYRLVVLASMGQMSVVIAVEALAIVPALFLGTWLGIKLFNIMPREIFRWFIIAFVFVLGLVLTIG